MFKVVQIYNIKNKHTNCWRLKKAEGVKEGFFIAYIPTIWLNKGFKLAGMYEAEDLFYELRCFKKVNKIKKTIVFNHGQINTWFNYSINGIDHINVLLYIKNGAIDEKKSIVDTFFSNRKPCQTIKIGHLGHKEILLDDIMKLANESISDTKNT